MTDDDRSPTDDDPFRPAHVTRREFLRHGAAAGIGLGVLSARHGTPHLVAALARAEPLAARLSIRDGDIVLGNTAITARWRAADGRLRAVRVDDGAGNAVLTLSEDVFVLLLADGNAIPASTMRITSGPRSEILEARRRAARAAERLPGRAVSVTLRDAENRLEAVWRAELRDGSRYVRQEVTLRALGAPLAIREMSLFDVTARGAKATGSVSGSPVAAEPFWFGFEHPLSRSIVEGPRARCVLARELPLHPGAGVTCSVVVGTARPGQLRRDVLGYVERERAHPYRTFLHYNSWYDLGYFTPYDEADALAVIAAFGSELVRRRGVVMSSFLFDDGWDDPKTVWGFGPGFPRGFTRVRAAAARYGAAPGVWMSPWGGYGAPKQQRLATGRTAGFETNAGGFALSGPRYYRRFHDTCVTMIERYGVNQFKFDGTGNAAFAVEGSSFDSDFDAAIALIGSLRALAPDLYVNLTTGTYPSPFWLRYADSIWRGGEDHDFAGEGSDRQQWITYRDADTYANVVRRGSLYPLNSLMLHGLIFARHARKLNADPGRDFRSEVRSYFGTGTQLQEMYITPALLGAADWDALAEGARWSRRNAATLVDTHWIGGDPAKLEPYGWAAWSPRRATVVLRNPASRAQTFPLDIGAALELPAGAPGRYTARSPWRGARDAAPITLRAGAEHAVALPPFGVVTLELAPTDHH